MFFAEWQSSTNSGARGLEEGAEIHYITGCPTVRRGEELEQICFR